MIDSPTLDDAALSGSFDSVSINEHQPAQTAMEHLLTLGHRRVGVVSTRLATHDHPGLSSLSRQSAATASVARGRLQGAAAAVRAAGLDWADVPVVQCQISSIEDGRLGAHILLDAAPNSTAVFAFSDPLALGARLAAHQRGLTVPGDLSIVGFDDSAPTSQGLTTIHQPLRDKGRIATERLLDAISADHPTQPLLLPTRLVVRQSTSRPTAASTEPVQV